MRWLPRNLRPEIYEKNNNNSQIEMKYIYIYRQELWFHPFLKEMWKQGDVIKNEDHKMTIILEEWKSSIIRKWSHSKMPKIE